MNRTEHVYTQVRLNTIYVRWKYNEKRYVNENEIECVDLFIDCVAHIAILYNRWAQHLQQIPLIVAIK